MAGRKGKNEEHYSMDSLNRHGKDTYALEDETVTHSITKGAQSVAQTEKDSTCAGGEELPLQKMKRMEEDMDMDEQSMDAGNEEQRALRSHKDRGARPKDQSQQRSTSLANSGNSGPSNKSVQVKDHSDIIKDSWKQLTFLIEHDGNRYKYDASRDIDPCLLQFFMETHNCVEFNTRLTNGIELKMYESQYIHAVIPGSYRNTEELKIALLDSIHAALIACKRNLSSCKFSSRIELEKSLEFLNQQYKKFLLNGLAGMYIDTKTSSDEINVKVVGLAQDIGFLIQELHIAQEQAKSDQSCDDHLQNKQYGQGTNVEEEQLYHCQYSLNLDDIHYLDALHFKKKIAKKCPSVVCRESDDNTKYEIQGANKEEVDIVWQMLDEELKNMKWKIVEVEPYFVSFFAEENVSVHINNKLRSLPAYIAVHDKVTLLYRDEEKLSTAENKVKSSVKAITVDGTLPEEEKRKVEADNYKKIKILDETEEKKIVLYTQDMEEEAKSIIANIQKNKVWREFKDCSRQKIEFLEHFNVIHDLKKPFSDVEIMCLKDQEKIRLESRDSESLKHAIKELNVYLNCIAMRKMNDLPNGANFLVFNENVRKYMKESLKNVKLLFLEEEHGIYLVCMKTSSIEKVYESLKTCFVSTEIEKKCLNRPTISRFLSEHKEQIYREDISPELSYICYTHDLFDEFHKLNLLYESVCSASTERFLQTYGNDIVKQLEKKHNVKAKIGKGHICLEGLYENGEMAMQELDRNVKTAIISEISQSFIESEEGKSTINEILKKERCCWEVVSFAGGEQRNCKDKDAIELGIEYLTKWILPENVATISVTEVDFKIAKLDVVIIPLNTCFFGENILSKDREQRLYSNTKEQLLELGKKCELKEHTLDCKVTVGIGWFGTVVEGNKQRELSINETAFENSIFDCCMQYFNKGMFKVGIAVPNQTVKFLKHTASILAGFQKAAATSKSNRGNAELLLCVCSESESMVKEVNSCLKKVPCTRRQISRKLFGIFPEQKLTTKVEKKSLLEIDAECLVVALHHDLNLNRGIVSKLVSEGAGPKLQEYLNKQQPIPKEGEILVADSYDLLKKGIKKLIFGFIPLWKTDGSCLQILQGFIENCLLKADEYSCSTIAFPAFGTGQLSYPVRDVVSTLLNGIDKFKEEAIIGAVSTVYLAAPIFKDNDSVYQISSFEITRRAELKEKKPVRTENDIPFLHASVENMSFNVIENKYKQNFRSCNFVDVEVKVLSEPLQGQIEVSMSLWKLVAECNKTQDCLQKATQRIIQECESQAITGVNFYISSGFNISEADQVDIVTTAVRQKASNTKAHPEGSLKYLKHVRFVTDEAGYSNIADNKLYYESTASKGLMNTISSKLPFLAKMTPLQWKKDFLPQTKTFMNMILAGSMESDLAKAKKDIKKLFSSHGNITAQVKSTDEVDAHLNPGIVSYLKNASNENLFEMWVKCISASFDIKVLQTEMEEGISVRGSFPEIIDFEYYLENDFPNFPKMSTHSTEKLEVKEQHYGKSPHDMTVSVTAQEENPSFKALGGEQSAFEIQRLSFGMNSWKVAFECKDITTLRTDCIVSPVNSRMHSELGVAKAIADKAGDSYRQDCQRSLKIYGDLSMTECRETTSGILHFKKILHTCSPLKCDPDKTQEQLLDIQESVYKCLIKTDNFYMKSVAVPFISTGNSGFPVELCVQEYFRSVMSLAKGQTKSLKEVLFVDVMEEKVRTGSRLFCKCLMGEHFLSNFLNSAKIRYKAPSGLYEVDIGNFSSDVSMDAVVVVNDEKFSGKNTELQQLLEYGGHQFRELSKKEREKKPHSRISVVTADSKTFRYIFLAIAPVWHRNQSSYSNHVGTSTQEILEEANELKLTSLSLCTLNSGEGDTALQECCNATVETILQFQLYRESSLRNIQIATKDKNATAIVFKELVSKLQSKGVGKYPGMVTQV